MKICSHGVASMLYGLLYIFIFAAAVSAIWLLLLAWFIVYETRRRDLMISWQMLYTPFNKVLIAMIASILALLIAESVLIYEGMIKDQASTYLCVYPAQAVFVSIFEIAYVHYSWQRGKSAVENVFPNHTLYFKRASYVAQIMSLISPIAEIARSSLLATLSTEALPSINPIAFVINSLGGLTAILFDITVLVIFRKNTMATKKEGSDEMDSHFTIVFYAGCVANLAMWMSFGIFIGSSLTDDAFTSSVLLAMFFLSLLVVFADLFTLKVLLFWDKIRKDEIKKSKIESAIGKEEMMRLRARSIDAHGGVGGIFGSRQDSVEYGARFNNSQTTSMSYDLTHSIHRQNSFQKGSIGSRLLHLQNGSMESGINKRGSPDGCMLPSKRESLDNSNVNNVRDSLDSNLSQLLKRASTDYASSRKTSTSSILRQSGLSMEIIKDGSIEHLPMQRSKSARLTPIRNGSVDSDSRDRCVASRSKLSHTFADESKIDSRLRVGGDKTSLDSLIYRGHNSLKRSTNIKEPESLDLMSSIAEVDTNASSYGNAVPSIEPNSLNELIQTDPDFINSEKWSNVGDYSGSEGRLG